MDRMERFRRLGPATCAAVIDDQHPLAVEAVGGQERLVFEVSCEPGDEGLSLGAPCRHGGAPHGTPRVAAVLAGENPLPAAVTRGVRDADASATAGEGEEHA